MLSEDFNTAQNKILYVISCDIKDYKPFSDLCINADHKLKIHFSGSKKLIINKSHISKILKSHLSTTNKGYSEVPIHFHFLGDFYMGLSAVVENLIKTELLSWVEDLSPKLHSGFPGRQKESEQFKVCERS
jgi:hypothetical protein